MRQITHDLEAIYSKLCSPCGNNIDIYQHMPTLRRYASLSDHIVEFGVRWVVSTWALLAGKPSIMISYDINYHANIELVKQHAAQNGINFTFVQGSTLNVVIPETDLLFIDTLHTYAQLKSELALHGNKAKKFILLHDTTTFAHVGMDGTPKGLWDATMEFMAANRMWKVKELSQNNNGMAVLERS